MTKPNQKEEKILWKKGYKYIAGADEAGRGPLAGPIVAAAVIFAPGTKLPGLNDSKKLSPAQREKLRAKITEKALAFSAEKISAQKIDKLGIQKANQEVIRRALKKLKIRPDFALIDAIKIKLETPHKSVIKGDEKIFSVAAASILAKTERDKIMKKAHQQYPLYYFGQNAGYGTKKHLQAIKKHGPCSLHRLSFRPLNKSKAGGII